MIHNEGACTNCKDCLSVNLDICGGNIDLFERVDTVERNEMLDSDKISVRSKKEFDEMVKEYYVNMLNNARTLHKTGKCCNAKFASEFIAFSSLDDVVQYEQCHHEATPFKRCGSCFKQR